MNKQGYISFCKKYEVDPTDYDAVLETVDELEGMFGDKNGILQSVREYIMNNKVDLSTTNDEVDKSVVGLLEPNIVTVYQMIDSDSTYGKRFMSYDYVKNHGGISMQDYEKVATVPVEEDTNVNAVLEDVFRYGNIDPMYYANNPKARSISVSDILEYKLVKYYVDSTGFINLDEETTLTEDKELLAEEGEDEPPFIEKDEEEIPVKDLPETDVDDIEEDEDKTLLDYLQDRIGQQMSVAELNTVLQSLFSRYNDIFILESDIYNADLDETQELIINDDMEDYIINYDIIDVEAGIIEITDVNVE